jgi:ABC-2 type transport system permease protein
VSILKGVYLKGIGLSVLWAEAALLTGFGAAIVLFANRKLRKKLT